MSGTIGIGWMNRNEGVATGREDRTGLRGIRAGFCWEGKRGGKFPGAVACGEDWTECGSKTLSRSEMRGAATEVFRFTLIKPDPKLGIQA
jgi:hypothetical protein